MSSAYMQHVLGRKYAKRFNLTIAHTLWKDRYHVVRYPEVLAIEGDHSTVFVFRSGIILVWGEKDIITKVEPMIDQFAEMPITVIHSDQYSYSINTDGKYLIANDHFDLPNDEVDIKLSISYAIARSIQLDWNEKTIDSVWNSVGELPSNLMQRGRISLRGRQLKRLVGSILEAQFSINQFGLVEDRPDLFWDQPDLEQYYKKTGVYLELQDRWNVLSDKIAALQNAFEALRDEINTKHALTLEFIIVILIVFELLVVGLEYLIPV